MRRFLLIGGGVPGAAIIIGVIVAVVLVVQALGKPGEATAKFLPADTQVYFTVNFRPGASQLMKARKIHSIFKDTPGFDTRRDDLLDDLENETEIDFMDDVFPWIGKDISFALLDAPAEPRPEWVTLLQTKDRDASLDFLNDLFQYLEDEEDKVFSEQSYRDAIVYTEEDDEVSFGLTDEYALISSGKNVVEKTILDLESPPAQPLSENEMFLQVTGKLPSERFMLMFVRSMDLYRDAERRADLDDFGPLGGLVDRFPEVVAVSGSFVDKGMRLDFYSGTPTGAVEVSSENQLNTARSLPEDTLFMVSASGIGEAWKQLRDNLGGEGEYASEEFDDALDALKDETGVDLERDIIDELTGEIAFAVLPSDLRFDDLADLGTIEALLLAEVGDSSGMKRALEKLTDFLMHKADLQVRRRSVGDYEAVTLDLSDQDPAVQGYSPGYLFTEDLVALASTVESLERMDDARNGKAPSLRSSTEFSRLTDMAPDIASTFMFAVIAGIIGMVVDALPSDTKSEYDNDVRPFLEPLHTFLAASSTFDDFTVATVILTVKE